MGNMFREPATGTGTPTPATLLNPFLSAATTNPFLEPFPEVNKYN
jgi:hypothetical protein